MPAHASHEDTLPVVLRKRANAKRMYDEAAERRDVVMALPSTARGRALKLRACALILRRAGAVIRYCDVLIASKTRPGRVLGYWQRVLREQGR